MIRALRTIGTAALLLLGVLALATLVVPRLFGWTPFVVTSGSMAPTFGPGAVVIASPVDVTSLGTGDIVTFRDRDGLTTHRIVGVKSESVLGQPSTVYTTQGDANEEADPTPLDPRNIVGKAKFAVPHVGYAVNVAKTPAGAGALAALVLLLLFTGGENKKGLQSTKVREPAVTS